NQPRGKRLSKALEAAADSRDRTVGKSGCRVRIRSRVNLFALKEPLYQLVSRVSLQFFRIFQHFSQPRFVLIRANEIKGLHLQDFCSVIHGNQEGIKLANNKALFLFGVFVHVRQRSGCTVEGLLPSSSEERREG